MTFFKVKINLFVFSGCQFIQSSTHIYIYFKLAQTSLCAYSCKKVCFTAQEVLDCTCAAISACGIKNDSCSPSFYKQILINTLFFFHFEDIDPGARKEN